MTRALVICPLLFAVLALAATTFLTWKVPPFQGADSLIHFARAKMISRGQWVGRRVPWQGELAAGGQVERSVVDAFVAFGHIPGHPEAKVRPEDFVKAETARWDGRIIDMALHNTAPYPPFFYLPQAAAIAAGKALDLTVLDTLYLARLANALGCIIVGFWALRITGRARLPLFAVLLLPMSLFLYATSTQDGLALVTTALGAAFVSRALSEGRKMSAQEVWASAACFALVGMAKQPYAVLSLLLLVVPAEARIRRMATVAALAVSIGWAVWMAMAVQTPLFRQDAPTDQTAQLQFLLENPLLVFTIAVRTFEVWGWHYYMQFVGVLGWLDIYLPDLYYTAAYSVLGLALSLMLIHRPANLGIAAAVVAVMLASAALLFGGLYLVWTPVGQHWVDGVQGRYFLPLAALLPLALDGKYQAFLRTRRAALAEQTGRWLVLLFPVVSLLVLGHTITERYY